ncbi:hypothetical protein PIB30_051147 [Stylosanthes scabra]|uniref:Cupin type-1 domain-containing protein n=1 Tax=Stylosanthes scabra TaxID=79078 RepID=A0ABU6QHF1_9FABA|nr:hypothetical protein [Stylosanthes scabra]
MKAVYLFIAFLALASTVASAYDLGPLQDFCVATNDTKNGGNRINELPGLDKLSTSLARIDFAPKGLNPPHTYPRGSEILE